MIILKTSATISDDFANVIKSGKYEEIIYELMCRSEVVFPSKYQYNQEQAHGECDFVDMVTGEKYDAKLAFNSKHGKIIGSKNGNVNRLIKIMSEEAMEFSKCYEGPDRLKKEELTLYKVLENLVKKVKPDENGVFFFPFPITIDYKDNILALIGSDILQELYKALKKNDVVKMENLYVIYPALDGTIVLRNMNENVREYLKCPEFDDYILYKYEILK